MAIITGSGQSINKSLQNLNFLVNIFHIRAATL